MTAVLVLAGEPATDVSVVSAVTQAGFTAVIAFPGEPVLSAFDRLKPQVVLLDSELPVPSSFVPGVRRSGAAVVYYSSALSPYDLAALARQRGALHFPVAGGASALRSIIGDAVALRNASTSYRTAMTEAIRAAERSVKQARQVLQQSRDIVALSRDVRAEERIAAVVRLRDVERIRDTVVRTTLALRATHVPLEHMLDVVRRGFERGSLERGAPATRAVPVSLAEAEALCEETYRSGSDQGAP